jgi:hypothetical protein
LGSFKSIPIIPIVNIKLLCCEKVILVGVAVLEKVVLALAFMIDLFIV